MSTEIKHYIELYYVSGSIETFEVNGNYPVSVHEGISKSVLVFSPIVEAPKISMKISIVLDALESWIKYSEVVEQKLSIVTSIKE
jgi:hypothetical protein